MTFLGYDWYNDFELWPTYLLWIVGYFCLLFGSIVFHEIGHWIYFRRIGRKMKVRFIYEGIFSMRLETGVIEDYKDMSDDDYFRSLWWGVLFGSIPIIISGCFFFLSFLMIIPYGVGCLSDLKEINKVYKSRGQNFLNIKDEEE